MSDNRYKMSFTVGGLLHQESVKITRLYLESKDWNTVRDRVFSENILQARTTSTSKRICREVISRLTTFNVSELELFVDASTQEQGYLLWIAVCRCYKFVAEFASEVIREKFLTFQDFDTFFNGKAAWHEELDDISHTTLAKLRQVLFRIMHESEILSGSNRINTVVLTPRIIKVIGLYAMDDFSVFPVAEPDIKRWINE